MMASVGSAAASSSVMSAASSVGKYMKLGTPYHQVKEESQKRLSSLRSWTEFFDKSRMSKPADFATFKKRLSFNLDYFQNNYILLIFIIVFYFLITNLLLLFSVVFILGGFKLISSLPANEPSKILGMGPFTQSQAWAIYGCVSVIMFFFSGASSSLFWVATLAGGLVSLHGGFMDKPLEADFADAV